MLKLTFGDKTALRELVTYMMEDPRSISRVINVLWLYHILELVGDHTQNLCEQIVYVVKGRICCIAVKKFS